MSRNDFELVSPPSVPELDPAFRPAVLANRSFREGANAAGAVPLDIALERSDGTVSRFSTVTYASDHPNAAQNFRYTERLVKFLLWARGAYAVHIAGPAGLAEEIQAHYTGSATGRFDAELMGNKVYSEPFVIKSASHENLPEETETAAPLGRHLDGCRVGFDLGASDRKVAAVIDGKTVFSEEIGWDPRNESDPQWHFDEIMSSIKKAAEHMPRVDAVGGSSAGIYVSNLVKVASLFRGVSETDFANRVRPIFNDIQKTLGGIPFVVVNDGDVTALAGAMALDDNGVLGVAMGSSEAVGYVRMDGTITSWLNELAFAPVDYNPEAAIDEWSGDRGCGVQYFSQQCVGRLLPASGLEIDDSLSLPDKLVKVQEAMAAGDDRAAAIYRSIGTYLGYTIPHYAEFYDFRYLMIMGRVSSGAGGELMLNTARELMEREFPDVSAAVKFHIPSETEKRHGQAMAAASLPVITG